MRTKFTLKVLVLITIALALRCSTAPESLDLTNSTSNLTGKYSAKIVGDKLNLNLTFENQENTKILERSDVIDISEGYRLRMDSQLKTIAINVMSKTPKINTEKSIAATQQLIDDYALTHKPADMASEEVQGMFYYLSVFKMIQRYTQEMVVNKLAQLECATYNGYIVGLSPYHAKEDIIINKAHFTRYLSGKPTRLSTPEANEIIKILGESPGAEISLKELEARTNLAIVEKSKTLRTAWLEGGDCGCCGNYQGTCWFASGNCYIHDYLCQTCTPSWFCFSGCKPTPC